MSVIYVLVRRESSSWSKTIQGESVSRKMFASFIICFAGKRFLCRSYYALSFFPCSLRNSIFTIGDAVALGAKTTRGSDTLNVL